jgi:hypothetical protein
MTEEKIQHILEQLHNSESHTHRAFAHEFGDPWSGYTRYGCEIIFYPQTNTYTWEELCEHSLAGWYYAKPFEISEIDLVERLRNSGYEI